MLANETLAASMVPEEMVDAAINYMNVIQERLSYYEKSKLHSLERLLNNWPSLGVGAKVSMFFFSNNGTDSHSNHHSFFCSWP